MTTMLDNIVSEAEIKEFEEIYNSAIDSNSMNDQIQFHYGSVLVRSETSTDIEKGIDLLSELCKKNVNDRRDYMYYLAIGYAHLKNYTKAKEMLDPILKLEPTNQQVLQLKNKIQKRSADEIMSTVCNIGTGALIVGGIVGFAIALSKKKRSE